MLAGDDDHGQDEDADKLMIAQIIMIIVIIFFSSFIFLPYTKFVNNKDANQQEQSETPICSGRLHQYSICFAAGMLLSLSVIYILPGAIEAYSLN